MLIVRSKQQSFLALNINIRKQLISDSVWFLNECEGKNRQDSTSDKSIREQLRFDFIGCSFLFCQYEGIRNIFIYFNDDGKNVGMDAYMLNSEPLHIHGIN